MWQSRGSAGSRELHSVPLDCRATLWLAMTGDVSRRVCMVSMFVGDGSDWIAASLALFAMANAFCFLENRLFRTENPMDLADK